MTGAANRRRGADAERAVVNYLKANGWPNARRVLAGDGHQHSDIDGIPGVSIEVKDRAQSSWGAWRLQAIEQARPGDTVIVVRRTRGVTDVGAWEAQMPWWTWWAHTRHAAGIKLIDCQRTGRLWASTNLHTILAELGRQMP